MQNITPTMITTLNDNEVFVFGSNLKGMHLGGAARAALDHFGAKLGQGVGLQGKSYAIPTLEKVGYKKLDVETIGAYVSEFIDFAKANTDKHFYVTPIGCGIANFTDEEIAPLFADAMGVENISLPQSFVDVLNK